jgi:hypothetical protein
MLAVDDGIEPLISILIGRGADVKIRDSLDIDAATLARRHPNREELLRLIKIPA